AFRRPISRLEEDNRPWTGSYLVGNSRQAPEVPVPEVPGRRRRRSATASSITAKTKNCIDTARDPIIHPAEIPPPMILSRREKTNTSTLASPKKSDDFASAAPIHISRRMQPVYYYIYRKSIMKLCA